jgi:hypothetical protein
MKNFNPEKLVAIGEGLAAGFGPFTLHRWSQRLSFPALIARQFGVAFSLPLFEPPGIGNAPGFEPQPVIMPGVSQATVYNSLPPSEFANLSVPGMTLRDALERKPRQPWVMQNDALQTACNLIVGGRRLVTNHEPLAQVDAAAAQEPTGVMIALGFAEALKAAIAASDGSPAGALDTEKEFGDRYAEVAKKLSPATLLMFTVPDPFDTPFFLQPAHAAEVLRIEESWLLTRLGLNEDDYLKLPAVHEIGYHIFARSLTNLPSQARVPRKAAAAISARVAAWNQKIREVAAAVDAGLYDLHDLTSRLRTDGLDVGNRHLTADYLGGIYSLNGYYLGHIGHGVIANDVLALMRQPQFDLEEIASGDPSAQIEPARGRLWSSDELSRMSTSAIQQKTSKARRESVPFPDAPPAVPPAPAGQTGLLPLTPNSHAPLPQRLVLPEGLKQELELEPAGSYFGDGIAASNCESDADAQFDAAGQTLFGGLAMVDSHLRGNLRFTFTPNGPDRADFTLSFDKLSGEDAVLAAPVLFRMAFQDSSVSAHPAPFDVSHGEVDLTTGEVSKLRIYAAFNAIALRALVASNPHFPTAPLSFLTLDAVESPLEYSSAFAKFEQTTDGKLDFTFYGARFVPLGPGTKWPLNFGGPDGDLTLIPASGTVMHPHLRLTTKPTIRASADASQVALPSNCVREFTFHTHNTAFGDAFDLRVPELGGPCTGRAHIMGRAVVQFGMPSGGTMPIAIRHLPPAGIFSQAYPSPIADTFPVRLGPGPRGYDQRLRYPRASYTMEKISLSDDPFDVAMGAVDVKTGTLFSDHLHRAFIEQDVINALLRIESRVRQTSFFFRGPGVFQYSKANALMFRFLGEELLPYPAGLAYPQPDFTSSYYATLGASLTPYMWVRAIENESLEHFVATGEFTKLVSANRDEFSCKYSIPADPSRHQVLFRYANISQLGSFELHSLVWVAFGNSAANPVSEQGFDTVTFSGFGIWEKNGVRSLEQVAAQIWNNPDDPLSPYVGIQVSSGDVSNVDLRPVDPAKAQP